MTEFLLFIGAFVGLGVIIFLAFFLPPTGEVYDWTELAEDIEEEDAEDLSDEKPYVDGRKNKDENR